MWSGTVAHNGICGVGRAEDWVSHFMEHEISAIYDVAHGAGLAVVFPAWITYMAEHAPAKPAQLARRVFGVTIDDDTAAAKEGVARLRNLFRQLGLPTTMAELGIPNPNIDLLVSKLHENKGTIIGTYHRLDATATRAIYTLCL
jgi:hypothetical protein